MRLELLSDGTIQVLAKNMRKHVDATAMLEIDPNYIRLMLRKAEDNASGKCRFGAVTLYLHLESVMWEARYQPSPMLLERGRQPLYEQIEATSLESARAKAKRKFTEHYAGKDPYGIFNDEVTVQKLDPKEEVKRLETEAT